MRSRRYTRILGGRGGAIVTNVPENRLGFLCPFCQRITWHPRDVEHLFCPCCGGPLLPHYCEHDPTGQAGLPVDMR